MVTALKRMATALAVTAVFSLVFARDAYAYLDPGTGSYIFQLVIGMGLAGGFLVKTYWRQLLRFFSRGNGRGEDEQ